MFLLVGVAFLVIGIIGVRSVGRLVKKGLRATAVVVDVESSRYFSDDATVTYRPVVWFCDADGWPVRASSAIGTARPIARIGDQVQVIYDGQNPEHVIIDTPQARRMALFRLAAIMGAGLVYFQICQLVR